MQEEKKIQIHEHCIRCGRKLKSEEAKKLGYGPICWKKHNIKHITYKPLF